MFICSEPGRRIARGIIQTKADAIVNGINRKKVALFLSNLRPLLIISSNIL
jgi:hypothetical protein